MTEKKKNYLINETYMNVQIGLAIKKHDYQRIKTILLPTSYPKVSIGQKEEKILELALTYLQFDLTTIDFLKYFIFEYNVSRDVYDKRDYVYKTSEITDMFDARDLNKDLELTLNTNNKINKILKV